MYSVVVTTGSSGTQTGDITVSSIVSSSTTNSLTLDPASGGQADFNAPISISGMLTVNGAATLNLNGNEMFAAGQTYTGAVSVASGSTVTGSVGSPVVSFESTVDSATTTAEPLTVARQASFTAAVGATHSLSGLQVDADATVGGSITTTGNQTYEGAVTLTGAATLTVNGSSTTKTLNLGTVDGSYALTLNNTSGGAQIGTVGGLTQLASLTATAGAGITLTGDVSTTGTQAFNSAVVLAKSGTGTPTVTFSPSNSGAGVDFGSTITMPGSLTKAGLGTLTLTGSNTAAATISQGTLNDQGTLGAVTLAGGILAGSGSTGAITQGTGAGTIDPGSSAAAGLLQTGDLLLTNASTVKFFLAGSAPGTGYDQLAVTGAVSLNDPTLGITVKPGFTPTAGETFTLMSNDSTDPVSGTFADVPDGSTIDKGALRFTISYEGGDGNDMTLTRVQEEPAISLNSSTAKAGFGGPITFTASVGPMTPETATPTGTITFLDGSKSIGSSVLTGGTASLTSPSLAPGTHHITASYSGDLTFSPTTSQPVVETVAPVPPKCTMSSEHSTLHLAIRCNHSASGALTAHVNDVTNGTHRHYTLHGSARLSAGRTTVVTLKLPAQASTDLKRGGKLSASVALTVTDPGGTSHAAIQIPRLAAG